MVLALAVDPMANTHRSPKTIINILKILWALLLSSIVLGTTLSWADSDPTSPNASQTSFGSNCTHWQAPTDYSGLSALYPSPYNSSMWQPSNPPVLCGNDNASGQNATWDGGSTGGYSGYKPETITTTFVNYMPSDFQMGGGINYISMGGYGGSGGNAYGGESASTGGRGGWGGDLYLTFSPSGYTQAPGFPYAYYNNPSLYTSLTGIFAQSIGGNGGQGGDGGGNGGVGGLGGVVSVSNYVALSTLNPGGYGIFAQSLGGWGGSGTNGDSSWYGTGGSGGTGSAGASGGNVSVANYATIQTPYGIPIFAQSVGGNGGNGGNASGGWFGSGSGGSGGYGGPGGEVYVWNNGNLSSALGGGFGIFAQSVGGGGGNAGVSAGLNAIGASGGYAAPGSAVWVDNKGFIITQGVSSVGIYAQSIGGGGGSGGLATGVSAIGGSGGEGGNGGTVNVFNYNPVYTGSACSSVNSDGTCAALNFQAATYVSNGGAFGILAQSIGGGGGNGGMGISTGGIVASASIALGGSGGNGGSGGSVYVNNAGPIATVESNSAGIMAQSIGGGGGTGGGAISLSNSFLASYGYASGGSGGTGGSAGVVGVNCPVGNTSSACVNSATRATIPAFNAWINTAGVGSPGIVAESIGGGGGAGGYAVSVGSAGFSSVKSSYGGSGASGGNGADVYASPGGVNILTTGSDSPGLIAASIGGGGGNGGASVSGSFALTGISVASSMGGTGGTGGGSGGIAIENDHVSINGTDVPASQIVTYGARSFGLLGLSIGGGGGSGGSSLAVTVTPGSLLALSSSIGGSGGSGGNAYGVRINNDGLISTYNTQASAIVGQSIGGGGGNGGNSFAAGASLGVSGVLSVGGSGGSGGNADYVNITNTGALQTLGGGAAAVLAQSIGGGGGNGGTSISDFIGFMGGGISVGGTGGNGGTSGNVTVNNYGSIAANNSYALNNATGATAIGNNPGILAQSIGGGGGNAGYAVGGADAAYAATFAIGTSGGNGGHAGTVTVNNYGSIETQGHVSAGITAQSFGGNGGNGAMSVAGSLWGSGAFTTALGGDGGAGGQGLAVNVTSNASITTNGLLSPGILSQSVGGSGGSGGMAIAGGTASVVALTAAIGGNGNSGGSGGNVTDTITGTVVTQRDLSAGVVAQSIGGNGGSGGNAITGALGGNLSAAVSLGGNGGAGGTSGIVQANVADVFTNGLLSPGVVVQSIGGTGGNGGFSGSLTGSSSVSGNIAIGGGGGVGGCSGPCNQAAGFNPVVSVNLNGQINTMGDQSSGVVAQSIGGNGGNGGSALSGSFAASGSAGVAIGNSGGSGGKAGDLLVNAYNSITTNGLNALGVVAQSIGGNGGNGGSSQSLSGSDPTGNQSFAASVAVGGDGGSGGNGRSVNLNQVGSISTAGAWTYGSIGILAQSIGGNGGNGGNATSNAIAGGGTISMSVGGNGGVGANSDGAVNVWSNNGLSTGGIYTSGMNAVAIMAQSIGGGGGNGGWAMSSSTSNRYASGSAIGGWGGDGGYATYVNVYSGGTLSTTGMQSSGIVAQSIGGGGGNGGSSSSQVSSSPGSAADGVTAVVGSTVANLGGNNAAVNAATWASRNAQDQLSSTDDMPNDGVSGSMAVGGLGGTGGTGGAVSVSSISTIITTGVMSNGIVAQSIGGGGGNGGDSTSGADGGKYSAAISVGGYGASGGTSGEVLVDNSGYISTTGNHAIGIYAQSIGGGGGGGGSSAASSAAAAGGAAAVSMGVGGWGADGGTGGMVTVNNNGSILTSGIKSAGIYAQSIGGGGGNGGSSTVSSEVAAAESDSGPSSAGTGGTSAPTTSNDSNSSTAGNTASGQNTSAAGADKGTAIGLSIGGFGGQGGIANDVFVTNTGIIITGYQSTSANSLAYTDLGLSDGSVGIFAQSVGGGGGDGGSTTSNADGSKNSVSLALGGFGGTGGDGRDVGVSNFGMVITYGHNSTAIFAQSVGGGGGNGGASSVTSGSGGSNAVAIGLGGRGGAAGSGSSVSVTNSGSIATYGALSYGVLAQSVGGGGGNGGDVSVASTAGTSSDSGEDNAATANSDGSTSSEAKSGVSVAASLGGAGGAGGTAGIVTITNTGSISTAGIGSTAVIAQSIGGGGGNSGASSSESNGGAYNANLSLGMKGGSGGAGNTVNVNSTGSISAAGANAMGIFAQSVGGGGGNATSNSATSSGSSGSSGKAGVAMSMGANGGSGNTGGMVNVSLNGTVLTSGINAIGIFAQSVGGGGGNGATSQSSANGGDAAVALSLGGTGGSGGTGGAVNVYAIQSVSTKGANAQGIFAQSIGGGGGNGGSSSSTSGDGGSFNANLTLGGSGTTGANADAVLVSTNVADYNSANSTSIIAPSNQSISTAGVNAQGILAQSVGGGGGNGGDSSSLTNNSDNNTKTKMVGLSLGGEAGAGGNGGTVTVNNALSIGTTGAYSQAILAQSIGGGGGNGGSSSSGPADNASTFNLALGANGGSGGNGGLVFVTSTGSLSTTGLNASALVAQSIAGGGGAAGATDNNSFGFASSTVNSLLGATNGTSGLAGTVSISTSGNSITTWGHNSMGIIGQSINGGGGISNASLTYTSGTVNYQATLGGSGVTNASANEVTINASNAISTTGANAVGIMAQSIGGGGGVSTTTVTGGSVSMNPVTIGGQSSTSGNGLAVNVTQTGAISTSGAAAIGIVAQSVGGGGGYAALASLNANTTLTNPTNVTIGGSGGSSGNGGDVNVTVGAPITTHGNNAVGVIAQSVGGGGGILLTSGLSAGVTPTFSGGTGNGGNVTVNVNAPISIYGAGVYGVIAQSIGGGGGMVISESGVVDGSGKGGGEGGLVTVNVNSSIYVNGYTTSNAIVTSTNGASAYGVYAKSIGTSDPNVTVAQGASVVAAGGSAAIVLDGLVNQLTNYGSVIGYNPQIDTAVKVIGAGGVTQITNHALMSGRLSNDGSAITLNNASTGRLYLANVPDLGGGVLTNGGFLQFSSLGSTGVTNINHTGSFVQTASGVLGMHFDFSANQSDVISAAQSIQFTLAGKIKPLLVNAGLIEPGSVQKTILTTGGSPNVSLANDLGIAGQTAIMSYGLSHVGNNLSLSATANFAPAGLSQFGSQVGQAIGTHQTAGSNAFFQAATAQLVMQPDVPTLDQAYQGLAGTAIQSVSQSVFQAVNQGIGSYTDRMNDWRISTATSKASRTASFNHPLYAMNNSNAMTDAVLDSNSYLPAGRSGPWITLFQSNVFSNSLNDRIFGGSAAYEVESDQHDKMGGGRCHYFPIGLQL